RSRLMTALPTLSVALAEIVTVPASVAPEVGEVIAMAGAPLSTVTLRAAEVVMFQAASRATAVKVCAPLLAVVVFHETEYGTVVSSAFKFTPSSLNCTPTTPTLSLAFAETVTVPATEAPGAGEEMETVGGLLSTVTLTAAEVAELPASSRAT